MSTFLIAPIRHLSDCRVEDNEIREIFYQHWEKMRNQMVTTIDAICRWQQNAVANINKYANEQIRILRENYDRQRHVFDTNRRANIDTAIMYVCEAKEQIELFDQLRNECRKLEFQVAKLEMVRDNMDYIKVITVNDQIKMKQEDMNLNQNITKEENTHERVKSTSNLTLIDADRINRQASATNSSYEKNLRNDNHVSRTADDKDNKDVIDRCPICCMIYSSRMSYVDRSVHINEHYEGDSM